MEQEKIDTILLKLKSRPKTTRAALDALPNQYRVAFLQNVVNLFYCSNGLIPQNSTVGISQLQNRTVITTIMESYDVLLTALIDTPGLIVVLQTDLFDFPLMFAGGAPVMVTIHFLFTAEFPEYYMRKMFEAEYPHLKIAQCSCEAVPLEEAIHNWGYQESKYKYGKRLFRMLLMCEHNYKTL